MGSKHEDMERAFLASYDANADALFRHCLIRVRNRELAKDLVQETFTRTWGYLAEGNAIDHVRAFLYRTLQNVIVDTMRRKKSVSLDEMHEEEGFEPADEHPDPGAEVREEARMAVRLVSMLDETYASAISLRYMEGLTPGEIAKILGVSENVVSVRIHRGLKQLRELWNQHQEYGTL